MSIGYNDEGVSTAQSIGHISLGETSSIWGELPFQSNYWQILGFSRIYIGIPIS